MSLIVDIEKTYGSFHLRAQFETGDGVTGILGASGSGKSLTLKCIAGIDRPDRGRIELDGVVLFDSERHINLAPQKRHVGYLFQSYALFPNMTVRQNILCGLHAEKDKAQKMRIYRETVRLVGLEQVQSLLPHQLSGGQQQRAALARILVNRPKLLMLDEPFSALDPQLKDRLCVEMQRILREYGGPTLLVTHDSGEAYTLCRSIAIVDGGTVFAPRETKRLFDRPQTVAEAVMTGRKNIFPAEYYDETHVWVPALCGTFETETPPDPTLCAIGIDPTAIRSEGGENACAVTVADRLITRNGCTVLLTATGAEQTPLCWETAESNPLKPGQICTVYIPHAAIRPLYPAPKA